MQAKLIYNQIISHQADIQMPNTLKRSIGQEPLKNLLHSDYTPKTVPSTNGNIYDVQHLSGAYYLK